MIWSVSCLWDLMRDYYRSSDFSSRFEFICKYRVLYEIRFGKISLLIRFLFTENSTFYFFMLVTEHAVTRWKEKCFRFLLFRIYFFKIHNLDMMLVVLIILISEIFINILKLSKWWILWCTSRGSDISVVDTVCHRQHTQYTDRSGSLPVYTLISDRDKT